MRLRENKEYYKKSNKFDYNSFNDNDNDNDNENNINYKEKNYYSNNYHKIPPGIKNDKNNSYLNSALHIIANCDTFVDLLDKYHRVHSEFITLLIETLHILRGDLNVKVYNPLRIMSYCSMFNEEYKKTEPHCSQNFIRILIKNVSQHLIGYEQKFIFPINESLYNKIEKEMFYQFCNNNKIFPESMSLSLFSIILENHSYGKCCYCYENIENYFFSYNIDQIIYLDKCRKREQFSDVLDFNFENCKKTMDCPKCQKQIEIKEENKIMKLPEILIFTLERILGVNDTISVDLAQSINMQKYVDKYSYRENMEYELFAINVRLGKEINSGHQLCAIKKGDIWYEINDQMVKKINPNDCNYLRENSYGLFYRKRR